MQPTTTKKQYTYADYAELEEGAPYQLINADLVMSPSPSRYHQRAALHLSTAFHEFVEAGRLGQVYMAPFDVYLRETEVYQPDILFVAKDRLNIITDQYVSGAPDLVVEVISPSTGYYDLTHKREVYAEEGVQEYWLVDPMEKTIQVLRNTGSRFEMIAEARDTGEVTSALLEGFVVTLDEVFAW